MEEKIKDALEQVRPFLQRDGGTEVELEGKKYIVVKQNDILAVIK